MSPAGAPGPPEGREPPLSEFPLIPGPEDLVPGWQEPPAAHRAAPLGPRAMAATADLAAALLGVSLPIVAAAAWRGRWPTTSGLAWATAFALTLSLTGTVASLFLFGRTVGMALAGLSISPDAGGRLPTAGQAARRWVGAVATGAALGLPLLWTLRDPGAPTPADRLSGRPLVEEE